MKDMVQIQITICIARMRSKCESFLKEKKKSIFPSFRIDLDFVKVVLKKLNTFLPTDPVHVLDLPRTINKNYT